jgi:glycerol kinase
VIVGLTRYANRGHLARATLEATAFQTYEVLEAMERFRSEALQADGGMVANELLMQFRADILDVPVLRPRMAETTALGAAYATGLAVGHWSSQEELRNNWQLEHRFEPAMPAPQRARLLNAWSKAVRRSFAWVKPE